MYMKTIDRATSTRFAPVRANAHVTVAQRL